MDDDFVSWMGGPEHSFMIINASDLNSDQCFWCNNAIPWDTALRFPDDLFSYLFDSFQWIEVECLEADYKKIPLGNNRWGTSLIRGESAITMLNIITSWKTLFLNAPEKLTLTGNYTIDENDNGYYKKVDIHRQDLIDTLSALESMLNTVIESNGEKYLFHSGV